MEETFGIFIFDKSNNILICRPTGIKGDIGWTIPKGKAEKNESKKDAAIRETYEEAGIDLKDKKDQLIEIGWQTYRTKKKKIFAFALHLNDKIDINLLKCDCKITGKSTPEIDKYEIVSAKEAIKRIHEAQSKLLEKYINGKD